MAVNADVGSKLNMDLDSLIEKKPAREGRRRVMVVGRRSSVRTNPYARPQPAPQGNSSFTANLSAVSNRLFVGNLAYQTSWQDLKDVMRKAGNVAYVEVFADASGKSKGSGIVEFETRQEAVRAIKTLNEMVVDGRPIYLREDREDRNSPRVSNTFLHPQGRQIFVGNLPYTTSWQDLKDLFRKCGNVIRADVLYAPDGRPKGAGTVLFESNADALRAIRQLNNKEYEGRVLNVHEDKFA
jgi:RNA recognition motif-containing protein